MLSDFHRRDSTFQTPTEPLWTRWGAPFGLPPWNQLTWLHVHPLAWPKPECWKGWGLESNKIVQVFTTSLPSKCIALLQPGKWCKRFSNSIPVPFLARMPVLPAANSALGPWLLRVSKPPGPNRNSHPSCWPAWLNGQELSEHPVGFQRDTLDTL